MKSRAPGCAGTWTLRIETITQCKELPAKETLSLIFDTGNHATHAYSLHKFCIWLVLIFSIYLRILLKAILNSENILFKFNK